MADKIFQVDFKKLLRLNLLTSLQYIKLPMLDAALKTLTVMHLELLGFRSTIKNRMSYNGQVFSLRKMLNDKFDNIQRRITIGKAEVRTHLMLYRRAENKPVMLGMQMLNRRDSVEYQNEFIVNLPISLKRKEIEIKAWLDYYKLATKTYTIKYF